MEAMASHLRQRVTDRASAGSVAFRGEVCVLAAPWGPLPLTNTYHECRGSEVNLQRDLRDPCVARRSDDPKAVEQRIHRGPAGVQRRSHSRERRVIEHIEKLAAELQALAFPQQKVLE